MRRVRFCCPGHASYVGKLCFWMSNICVWNAWQTCHRHISGSAATIRWRTNSMRSFRKGSMNLSNAMPMRQPFSSTTAKQTTASSHTRSNIMVIFQQAGSSERCWEDALPLQRSTLMWTWSSRFPCIGQESGKEDTIRLK